uniref:Uncharacterized protein n=1 Tax=Ornithorhynchus anatinus TaxID=9258 RepID=A0A6I8P8U3_ORNAN
SVIQLKTEPGRPSAWVGLQSVCAQLALHWLPWAGALSLISPESGSSICLLSGREASSASTALALWPLWDGRLLLPRLSPTRAHTHTHRRVSDGSSVACSQHSSRARPTPLTPVQGDPGALRREPALKWKVVSQRPGWSQAAGRCASQRSSTGIGNRRYIHYLTRQRRKEQLRPIGCLLPAVMEDNDKLRLEREQEQKKASAARVNHALPREEAPPAPPPAPPPALAAPLTVIPIPVVTSSPQPLPPPPPPPPQLPLAPRQPTLVGAPGPSGKDPGLPLPLIRPPVAPSLLPDAKAAVPASGSPKPLQPFPASILTVVQQPSQPQPPPPQPPPPPPPPLGALKLAPAEDIKPNEQKKRPGG